MQANTTVMTAMRINQEQAQGLKQLATEVGGSEARLYLFGSRLDGTARGGDVDLLLQLPTPAPEPAALIARMAARASRLRDGRHLDVILSTQPSSRVTC